MIGFELREFDNFKNGVFLKFCSLLLLIFGEILHFKIICIGFLVFLKIDML